SSTPDGSGNPTQDVFVVKLVPANPLLASRVAPANFRAAPLTLPQAQPLLQEAIARWQATGVDVNRLNGVEVRLADLPGATLGLAAGHTLWLDDNAAGWGWFVDPTPWEDSEFSRPGNQGEHQRMDLLSAVMHELGHMLGLEHSADGVMAETLSAGTRSAASR